LELVVASIILVCYLLSFAIFIRAILSWFSIRPDHPVLRFLDEITDPILAPLRRIVPQTGGIDFTPMVAILILFYVIPLLLTMLLNSL
jgi:YggT family protein